MNDYDLELDRVAEKITSENAKIVCIQLPDGLRPQAKHIVDTLKDKTNSTILIWIGSCYGACDIPLDLNRLGVDLLIHWGHSAWEHS